MTLPLFTLVHILISLVGIATGFGTLAGLLADKLFPRWTAWFLVATVATSLTGFFFPLRTFTPATGVGIASLVVLGIAIHALYVRRLERIWRAAFVVSAVVALYLNVFVLIVQLFQKFPALVKLAPTQTEPAFAVTQLLVLLVFAGLTLAALNRFRPLATAV
jgi:hypothetical protein